MPHTTVAIHVERIRGTQVSSLNAWMTVWLSVQREGGSVDFGPAPLLCPAQGPPAAPSGAPAEVEPGVLLAHPNPILPEFCGL